MSPSRPPRRLHPALALCLAGWCGLAFAPLPLAAQQPGVPQRGEPVTPARLTATEPANPYRE